MNDQHEPRWPDNPRSVIRNRQSLARLYWLTDLDDGLLVPEQSLPRQADVVIVGGGYVGGSAALWLGRLGAGAVLIERRGISTGATGRNAGFIAPGLGQPFAEAVERHGRKGAIERLEFTRRGRDLALATIKELGIGCDLEEQGGLVVASSNEEWATLRDSGKRLRRAGFPMEIIARDDLGDHLHVPVPECFRGALFNPETLLVNPAKLNHAIVCEARRLGAQIHLHTEVTALVDQPDGRIAVETSRGAVTAGHVVLATNAWSPLLVSYLKGRIAPVRGQIFATEPAPSAFKRAMSTNWGYEYWSQRRDGRIILGGGRWAVPDRDEGYYAEELNPPIQSALYRFLTETFPSLKGVRVARQWSGIMGFSRDGYPFIGPLPERPRLLIAAGFTGHGGPYSQIAGRCLAELIVKGTSEEPLHHYALDRELPDV